MNVCNARMVLIVANIYFLLVIILSLYGKLYCAKLGLTMIPNNGILNSTGSELHAKAVT